MLSLSILALLALAGGAIAQTPDGFSPATRTPLSVVYPRNITASPPGVLLQKADTQVVPTVTAPASAAADGTYIIFAIDLDVPRNGGTTLLHWFEADFTLSSSRVLTPRLANSSTGAPYVGPSPPPGGPHRYTFLLFSQPSGFAVPASFSAINPPTDTSARIGFNITEFVAAAGLGAPLAGTYLTVVNNSATASSTGSPAATSPVMFEGGSSTMKSSIRTEFCFGLLLVAIAASFFAL